ncbi:hypothetical protein [Aliivibrio sp. SR45-2]|uniref:hypothetical protein n=1 Tax=Aliivibrio sp. SR45-2 TaxID=2760931 RepID=UPI002103246C|nr:hypothetical protein [Aliivibrio sp. SR45-2]
MNRYGRVMVRQLFVLFLSLLFSVSSYAYSYAAAGKEPVIEGREAILQALTIPDYAAVSASVAGLNDEFTYLKNEHQVDLLTPMLEAIDNKDAEKIETLMDSAVVEEIIRRLDGAENNLNDYQVAKVLVVKSKLFLDLLAPKMNGSQRQEATQAIQGALASIGNPGVFGVGKAPVDPAEFSKQKALLLNAIRDFK